LYSSANLMAGNNEKKMSRPEFIQFPYGLEDWSTSWVIIMKPSKNILRTSHVGCWAQ
jgi:hypothetical protein